MPPEEGRKSKIVVVRKLMKDTTRAIWCEMQQQSTTPWAGFLTSLCMLLAFKPHQQLARALVYIV